MWSDPDPQLGKDFQRQGLRITHLNKQATTMAIKGPAPAKKKKVNYLPNYTTGGPYGRARLRHRWTECRNKKLSTGSQLGP